jgi:hypothetical protein
MLVFVAPIEWSPGEGHLWHDPISVYASLRPIGGLLSHQMLVEKKSGWRLILRKWRPIIVPFKAPPVRSEAIRRWPRLVDSLVDWPRYPCKNGTDLSFFLLYQS